MGNLEETNMYIKVYKWVNYLWQPTLEQWLIMIKIKKIKMLEKNKKFF